MTPSGKPYLCYRGRRYRDQERRLELTFREGDSIPIVDAKEEEPMVEDRNVDKEFGELLLKLV